MKKLTPAALTVKYDTRKLKEYAKSKSPEEPIIGQERAVKALQFGLGNKAAGFNIFVAGYPGSGRLSAIKHFLETYATRENPPCDWCYVHNFSDPYCPIKLQLPKGEGRIFKNDITNLLQNIELNIVKVFTEEEYTEEKNKILKEKTRKERNIFHKMEAKALTDGFYLEKVPAQITALPLKGNRPMSAEEFQSLPAKEKQKWIRKQEIINDEIKVMLRQIQTMEIEYMARIADMEYKMVESAIGFLFEELREKYKRKKNIIVYLNDFKEDVLENFGSFLEDEAGFNKPIGQNIPEPPNRKYEVNLLVDNSETDGAPIVVELNPTYNNLFGKIEKDPYLGTYITDFTLIRKGALQAANNGFLVIPVRELLHDWLTWESLKRALYNQEIAIEEAGDRYGFISTKTLRPQPIPLQVQIILIGEPDIYYKLFHLEQDFKELFKVKVEFDRTMDSNEKNIIDFISLIHRIARLENLLKPNHLALGKFLEYAHRLAGSQEKLSTHFGLIADLLRESTYYARQHNAKQITAKYVELAINEKRDRSSLLRDKSREWVQEGKVFLDLDGKEIGQINGLAVLDVGDYAFGRPSRITASIGLGKSGIIDIEREAKMAGSLHTKGVMILAGYLAEHYGFDKPISMNARLVFEQSYGKIDGDSASSAELYALLSALSGIPLKQGIAVTGSVNQKGEVQPIGGVNEKVEGFFEVCRNYGLTGEQGVIIPASNASDLVLDKEVIQAVNDKKFYIWTVSNIDEGLEILTGKKAGKVFIDKDRTKIYHENTIHGLVNQRLYDMNQQLISMTQGSQKLF